MYLKLALRNAKRSIGDYLLYIFTLVILVAILFISNCIAIFGHMQAGFETASFPMLIVLIMVALVVYINTFMLKQRAKEFATYTLLGMDKDKLSAMFVGEIVIIGILCVLLGMVLGAGIYYTCISPMINVSRDQSVSEFELTIRIILQTALYFGIVELVSAFMINRKIKKLQIRQLMKEKNRNQQLTGDSYQLWRGYFISSLFVFFILLSGIAFLSDQISGMAISFIALPMLFCIFSFYKFLFSFAVSKRATRSNVIYHDINIYYLGEITTGIKTSAILNTVFCICLVFSICSFVFGVLLLEENVPFFSSNLQKWMGFMQISMCIIFMVIYFSTISLLQLVERKQQTRRMMILHYMGMNQNKLNSVVKKQIHVKLFLPIFMCFLLLLTGIPFVNYKLNRLLPEAMNHHFLKAVGLFSICFVVLYFIYYKILYVMMNRYIKSNIKMIGMD